MHVSKLALATLATHAAALTPWDEWEHGRVALEDVSIHFRYAGHGPPLLLVHGNPQFSLTWQTIGPLLAENYTVIAPDNRDAGASSIPPDGNYSATASAGDLKGVLDFLNITSTYVFAHDKGVGMAAALAAGKLGMPVLALGGEASSGIPSALRQSYDPVAKDLEIDVIPKAGHWIGESLTL
ncbi:Alpha/Beta hydrolase protein [Xylaria longipes]|nr:Alpha/Beta hydrolase protein [Xylaria longipes]